MIDSSIDDFWDVYKKGKYICKESTRLLRVIEANEVTISSHTWVAGSTIVSEGFKGGTRGAPIMPRDVSLSDSKCWNGGHEWVLRQQL